MEDELRHYAKPLFDENQKKAWQIDANNRHISELFNNTTYDRVEGSASSSRVQDFSINASNLFLDFSKQNITSSELSSLIAIADKQKLSKHINDMFDGEKINNTENRAVLHSILRAPKEEQERVLGPQAKEVSTTIQRMENIVDDVISGKLLTASGKKFTDVLAVGIGGSFYGIKLGLTALKPYCTTGLHVQIVANVDGAALQEKLSTLNAETTLVIVISKTFTTKETMLNAYSIKKWMLESQGGSEIEEEQILRSQWLAVSTNINGAIKFGIAEGNILPMWDWVGGRFSVWSAVGLPLALAIGNGNFNAFKLGAYEQDLHFKTAPFIRNMPIVLALIGIWNRNVLDYPSLCILPYDHSLRSLPGYLQQTDMESNGKLVNKSGEVIVENVSSIIFGQEGTNGQHAFMQMLHQGKETIPCDFIVSLNGQSEYEHHHQFLVANCLAQSEALMTGKDKNNVIDELKNTGFSQYEIETLTPHKVMPGNRPSNMLIMESLNPRTFGSLLALYEHKIFVQGCMWGVNSFDQWGVELGKQLGQKILDTMNDEEQNDLSPSSLMLINKFKQKTLD